MAYKVAIKCLKRSERIVIGKILRAFRTDTECAQIARNFINEEMLDQATHVAFLQQLAAYCPPAPLEIKAVIRAYKKTCALFSLQGPKINGSPVQTAGRAVAYSSFKGALTKVLAEIHVTLPQGALEVELRALAAQCAAQPARAADHTAAYFQRKPPVSLSGSPVWCCFLNPDRNTNPYVPPRHTAAAIRNAYGLGCNPKEEHVLLLYSPPEIKELHCPTVADANSYPHFRPAKKGQPHGWTEPIDPLQPESAPQPEAVHKSLYSNASELIFRIVPY